jgi:hypothetical protein
MMESYFFLPQFFLASFRPSPKLPRHTCGPFASHQCAAAHRLKIAGVESGRCVSPLSNSERCGSRSADRNRKLQLFFN